MSKRGESSWNRPSIKDLQRAALGKDADLIPDEGLDEYAASLIIKESHSKATIQNAKRASSSNYFFIQEPKIATATNKTFLANTIKNTSSYNEALRKRERKEGLKKRKNLEDKLERKTIRLGSLSHHEIETGSRRNKSATREYISGDYNEATSESYRRLGQMVNQSKLKLHKKSINSLDEVLGRNIDPGPFGPISKSNMNNEPNTNLPQNCPW